MLLVQVLVRLLRRRRFRREAAPGSGRLLRIRIMLKEAGGRYAHSLKHGYNGMSLQLRNIQLDTLHLRLLVHPIFIYG
ncbi:hypothetical protein D3C73_1531460 [compost metagenome]